MCPDRENEGPLAGVQAACCPDALHTNSFVKADETALAYRKTRVLKHQAAFGSASRPPLRTVEPLAVLRFDRGKIFPFFCGVRRFAKEVVSLVHAVDHDRHRANGSATLRTHGGFVRSVIPGNSAAAMPKGRAVAGKRQHTRRARAFKSTAFGRLNLRTKSLEPLEEP